jgi:hypothetical protein
MPGAVPHFDRCAPRGAAPLSRKDPDVTEDEEMGPIVTLDLRTLRIHLEELDGDLTMLVDDGEVEIEFSSGTGGSWEEAIVGAKRLASTALAFAEALRTHRPTRPVRPLTPAGV